MSPAEYRQRLQKSSNVLSVLFSELREQIKPGISTGALDRWISDFLLKTPCRAYLKQKFHYSSHISTGRILCHGIPSDGLYLQDGATVNIDIPLIFEDTINDASWTFSIGSCSQDVLDFLEFSRKLTNKLVHSIKEGAEFDILPRICQKETAFSPYYLFSEGQGHSVGKELHEEPFFSYSQRTHMPGKFRNGMIFTVEPVLSMYSTTKWAINVGGEILLPKEACSGVFEVTCAVIDGKIYQLSLNDKYFPKGS